MGALPLNKDTDGSQAQISNILRDPHKTSPPSKKTGRYAQNMSRGFFLSSALPTQTEIQMIYLTFTLINVQYTPFLLLPTEPQACMYSEQSDLHERDWIEMEISSSIYHWWIFLSVWYRILMMGWFLIKLHSNNLVQCLNCDRKKTKVEIDGNTVKFEHNVITPNGIHITCFQETCSLYMLSILILPQIRNRIKVIYLYMYNIHIN
jgi:hypothetical protein